MLFLWVSVFKRVFPVLLLFPIAIDSYTLFFHPGLMWKDIGLIVWLLYAIIYVKKIGTVTLLWGALLIGQIFLNLLHMLVGDFKGGMAQIFITPLHIYLPLLVVVLILENRSIDVHKLWSQFNKLIFPMAIIMVFITLIAELFEHDIKQVPGVASTANLVAVGYPLWLAFYSKRKGMLTTLSVSLVTFLFLALSHTRGALIVCVFLSIIVLLVSRATRQKITFIIGSASLGAIMFSSILYFSPQIFEGILSIINLYKEIYFYQGESIVTGDLKIDSGDTVRFLLWNHAFDVWCNNFLFGLGSGQYDSSGLFDDRNAIYSPHHAVLSVAVDGGAFAVLLSLLPQLYLIAKTWRGNSYEQRVVFNFSWLHIAMSFIFGYSFSFIFVVAYYLVHIEYPRQNRTQRWRRI